MNTIKCPNCGHENKNTNIRCESCSTELNHIEQSNNFLNNDYSQTNVKTIFLGSKKSKHIKGVNLIFKLAPWFLIGLAFIGISLYSSITDNSKSKNYLETEGKLISYENCQYDNDGDELCYGVYEYTVNGVTYTGSPNMLSNRSGFEQTATVKYNPDNPNEYVMDSGWNVLLIVGIIMVSIVTIIFISFKLSVKKLSKKANDIEKEVDCQIVCVDTNK